MVNWLVEDLRAPAPWAAFETRQGKMHTWYLACLSIVIKSTDSVNLHVKLKKKSSSPCYHNSTSNLNSIISPLISLLSSVLNEFIAKERNHLSKVHPCLIFLVSPLISYKL